MRIHSMTATFGKLERETLTFQPGLNVIHAPNEWGKSTWCSFLCAMLYGIDTRERSKQGVLADKERYAPWSGSPMSGRMDISWKGKDITIERSTKGRTPFGAFRAYETASGLPVPELTAANCGQVLLGVEKSVFIRSAFIKQTDLPVEEDEALRRRLNALVTTGDETGASDDLAEKLKNLKNRCRHNKTGLLPQAETQQQQLEEALRQLTRLQAQAEEFETRQAALEQEIAVLENHKATLAYQAAQADIARVDAVWAAADLARQEAETKRQECAEFPDREDAQNQLLHLEQLLLDREALDARALPVKPEAPSVPHAFYGMTPREALSSTQEDKAVYDSLRTPVSPLFLLIAIFCLGAAVATGVLLSWLWAIPLPVVSLLFFILHFHKKSVNAQKLQSLTEKYPGIAPELWISTAKAYARDMQVYEETLASYEAQCRQLESQKDSFGEMAAQFTGGLTIQQQLSRLREALSRHDALARAEEAVLAAENHARALAGMVKAVAPPSFEDPLTLDSRETEARLLDTQQSLRQLKLQQGQVMGQMDALGSGDGLRQQLAAVRQRICKLEDIYSATVLAMETLSEASAALQRKFAPRISRQAQALFGQMTAGRYDRLLLDQELKLHTAASGEDQLRPELWRSEGTMDQLYLSLRLAVAEELTPEAPLVLDDALVRFDDTRLSRTLDILKNLSRSRQVILFSCQKREKDLLQIP